MELWRGIWNIAACEMRRDTPSGIRRHRAAEIVASQGSGSTSPPAPLPQTPIQPHVTRRDVQDYLGITARSACQPARQSRQPSRQALPFGGSFVSTPGMSSPMVGGYPAQRSPQNSFECLSGHLPCTAAALGSEEDAVPGRGLYVSMQRGCFEGEGLKPQSRSFEVPSANALARRPAKIRSESPGRMIAASEYVGAPEDAIDETLAAECRRLPPNIAKVLLIRRIAAGEYEVDGAPVRFSWQHLADNSMQVVVSRLGADAADEKEPLLRYLQSAGATALKKSPTELELPSFPWPFDLLAKTNSDTRKVMPIAPAGIETAKSVSARPSIRPPPQGASLQLQPPRPLNNFRPPDAVKAPAPKMCHSFVMPSATSRVQSRVSRSPSLMVPVPTPIPVPRAVRHVPTT